MSEWVLSRVRLFTTPWTGVHQASLPMGFSRQESWSWLSFPITRGSPQPRNPTRISCISYTGRWIFYHWNFLNGPGQKNISLIKMKQQSQPRTNTSRDLHAGLLFKQIWKPKGRWGLLLGRARFFRKGGCSHHLFKTEPFSPAQVEHHCSQEYRLWSQTAPALVKTQTIVLRILLEGSCHAKGKSKWQRRAVLRPLHRHAENW